tara:strand:+ start:307 stop:501 length:195 start_codon:yes stop_codon:yes gene_type:complete
MISSFLQPTSLSTFQQQSQTLCKDVLPLLVRLQVRSSKLQTFAAELLPFQLSIHRKISSHISIG